ncbi:MAG: choice-of-anchor Q domain-containing protein [bacterium]
MGAIEIDQATAGNQHWDSDPNHIVRNNLVRDFDTDIRTGTGCLIYNNIIYAVNYYSIYVNNTVSDSYTRKIYHNTTDVSGSNAFYSAGGTADIRNNIGPATVNNMAINSPYFISTEEGSEDYHLIEGSGPIDAGVDLTSVVATDFESNARPEGSAVDMGAYEYVPQVTSNQLSANRNNVLSEIQVLRDSFGVRGITNANLKPLRRPRSLFQDMEDH